MNMSERALKELQALRKRIEHDARENAWNDVWFFPQHRNIAGWAGTGHVMFVGLNPSTGRFPSRADEFLYEQLAQNEFHQAHITDVIKCRATTQEVNGWLTDPANLAFLQRQLTYLREEIRILDPRLIVPFGHKVYLLMIGCSEVKDRIKAILPHYSQRFRSQETDHQFIEGLKSVRKALAV